MNTLHRIIVGLCLGLCAQGASAASGSGYVAQGAQTEIAAAGHQAPVEDGHGGSPEPVQEHAAVASGMGEPGETPSHGSSSTAAAPTHGGSEAGGGFDPATWTGLILSLALMLGIGVYFFRRGDQMKLVHKVAGIIGVLLVGLLGIGVLSIIRMDQIGTELMEIAEEDIPLTNLVSEITVKQVEQSLWLERAISGAEVNNLTRVEESTGEFDRLAAEVDAEIKEAEKIAEHAIAASKDADTKAKFDEINQSLHRIEQEHASFDKHGDELLALLRGGQVQQAHGAIEAIEAEETKLIHELEGFMTDLETFTANAALSAEHHEQSAVKLLTIASVAMFVFGLVVGVFVIRSVTRQLGGDPSELQQVAEKVAAGDLTTDETLKTRKLSGTYGEIVRMQDQLTGVVRDAQAATALVRRGTDEISQGNASLSQRTEEQASSLEETASSMEEMTATVKQNADNAREANQLAAGARDQAEQGGEVVGQAVAAMSEINTSSKKIADIIGVIDEIAFQTNLLALNAAVEAARAGEQGRGFAVVASEVRNLAQRSATAAKEIKTLIEDSVGKVQDGSKLVDQSGETLKEIVNSVKKVSDIVAEIAAASQEQSAGIEQVNKAIMQMDDMTQQNAALVEEAASASEAMGDQTRNLSELMGFFTVDDAHQAQDRSTVSDGTSEKHAASAAERRTTERPWTGRKAEAQELQPEAAPPKLKKAAAGGGDDGEWAEF